MELITQKQISEAFGCSEAAVSQLKKKKKYLFFKVGKKYNKEKTVAAIAESGELKKRVGIGGKRHNGKKKANSPEKPDSSTGNKSSPAPTTEEHEQDIEQAGPLKLTDSRERIEKHKAFHQSEKVRIENKEKQKKLVDVNTLSDSVFNFIRQFREHQQGQKDRIGSKVEGAESRHEIERIIEDDNHHGLSVIAENFDDLSEDELKKKILQVLIP